MLLYESSLPQFAKMLRGLDAWLIKAEAHAQQKGLAASDLLEARLAPDQYPLLRQVQVACDAAKNAAAHLAGREPPKHPDTEKTMAELHERIRTALAYVESVKPDELAGAESRHVTLGFLPGKYLFGADYLVGLALPNFYFHVTTAYAIMRHLGVDLGKRDFIGGLPLHDG